MELKFQVQIKIQKPLADVFQAVYDPKKLSSYFTNGGASAPLDTGTTVQWAFEDRPGQKVSFPIQVKETVMNERILFTWAAHEGKYDPKAKDGHHGMKRLPQDNLVEIAFEALGPQETLVKIAEGGWPDRPGGIDGAFGNCMGWSTMMSFLKAYLEYGINLRKGAF